MKRTLLLASALLLACATTRPTVDPVHAVWFHGSVEQAFQQARQENKPIFLYWGAVWCPPCNEIKSQVFSTPEFAELMRTVVPVYLDGDSEQAQAWADKLHVSGYPTMLVLDPSGRELMRIGEFVDPDEFSAAFRSALATARPLNETVKRALAGQATDEDWNILAYAGWDSLGDPQLMARLKIFEVMPRRLIVQRAVFAGKLLESASMTQRDSEAGKAIRQDAQQLLGAIFFFDAAVFAARSTIVEMGSQIVSWLYPDPGKQRTALIAQWTKASDWIQSNPQASVSERLLAVVPKLELWQLDHPKQALPQALSGEIHEVVAKADAEANTRYLRHAVISDAAQILAEAGDFPGAVALLENELRTTDTPWYDEAVLADLEMDAGHQSAALEWSAKARESARGDATRLQWIGADIQMNLRSTRPDKWVRCAALWPQLFDAALALPDGLSGRNAARTARVFAAMRAAHPSPGDLRLIAPAYDAFMRRCVQEGHAPAKCYAFVGAKPSQDLASAMATPGP